MATRRFALAALLAIAGLTVLVATVGSGSPAHAQESTATVEDDSARARRVATRAAYRAHIATQGTPSPIAEPPATCPEGFVHWERGVDVELCTNTCTSGLDCLDTERCRVLSREGGPAAQSRFADEAPIGAAERVVGLCDPFWGYQGVVTAVPLPVSDTEADSGFASDAPPAEPDVAE